MTALYGTRLGLRALSSGPWRRISAVLVAALLGALITTGLHPAVTVTGGDEGAPSTSSEEIPAATEIPASDTLLLTGTVSAEAGSRSVDGPPGACPVVVMERLRYVFRWHLDFPDDLRPGDSFRAVLLASSSSPSGVRGAPGPGGTLTVLGAEIETRGHLTRAIGRPAADGEGRRFYAPDGTPVGASRIPTPDGFRMTSRFDRGRLHPVLREERPHLGVDYAVPRGEVVRAVAAGRVSRVERDPGLGLLVEVRHDARRSTRYAHLSSVEAGITSGTPVEAGQPLGRAGATGLATAPHLHFELLMDGRQRNPLAQHAWGLFPDRRSVEDPMFAAPRDRVLELLASPTRTGAAVARMELDGNPARGPRATTAQRVLSAWEAAPGWSAGAGSASRTGPGSLTRWPLPDQPDDTRGTRPAPADRSGPDASGAGISCTLDRLPDRSSSASRYWIATGVGDGATGGPPIWETGSARSGPPTR